MVEFFSNVVVSEPPTPPQRAVLEVRANLVLQCSRVDALVAEFEQRVFELAELAADRGFRVDAHRFDMVGLCSDCH